MAGFNLTESVRRAFLAGVGAVATGAEKMPTIIDELVKKGEITVEQGKELNDELARKAKEAIDGASDAALGAKLKGMTAEERAKWMAKAKKIIDQLDAETIEVEVEDGDESDDEA